MPLMLSIVDLDVVQGRTYGAPNEDQTHYTVVMVSARKAF